MSIGAGLRRKWLGLRCAFAGHARRRHRLFLDRPHRLAGDAIEHVDERLLGHLRHRLDRLSADGDVDQGWRRRRCRNPTIRDARAGSARPSCRWPLRDRRGCRHRARRRAGGRHSNRWSACLPADRRSRGPRPRSSAPRHWRCRPPATIPVCQVSTPGSSPCGTVWNVQSSRPVTTSKPRTSPGGDGLFPHQSITDEPTTMTPRTITGGELMV